MPVKTQFTLSITNKPGSLAELCNKLARKKVNIEAIAVVEGRDFGTVQIIASPAAATRTVLRSSGLAFSTDEVVITEMPNEPGMLACTADKLHQAGLNVDYLYSTSHGEYTTLVAHVSDPKKASKLLKSCC